MSCDLSIELDREEATFRAGERVRGWIVVTATEACDCGALTVCLRWCVEGQGNEESADAIGCSLGAFQFRAGERASIPFELQIPWGPLSYKGTLFVIRWEVMAQAALRWAFDARTRRPFEVRPGNPVEVLPGAHAYRDPPRTVVHALDRGPLAPPPGSRRPTNAAVGSLVAVAVGVTLLFFGHFEPVWSILWGGLALVGGAALLRKGLGRMALGTPTIEIEQSTLAAGQPVRVRVTVAKKARLANGTRRVVLVGEEFAVSGHDSRTRLDRHLLWREEATLKVVVGAARGMRAFEATLQVPPNAAPTFEGHHNAVKWSVVPELAAEGWPAWSAEYAIAVVPSTEPG